MVMKLIVISKLVVILGFQAVGELQTLVIALIVMKVVVLGRVGVFGGGVREML